MRHPDLSPESVFAQRGLTLAHQHRQQLQGLDFAEAAVAAGAGLTPLRRQQTAPALHHSGRCRLVFNTFSTTPSTGAIHFEHNFVSLDIHQ